MKRLALAATALGILLAASGAALAAIPKGDVVIDLETVASGLVSPIGVTHAGDGSGRLFILDQIGLVRIVKDGALVPAPFLDISDRLPALSPGFDERGLLGLAFHPDYAANGRFFVRYSAPREGAPGDPCFGTSRGCSTEVLSEFSVSADPDAADPGSERILFAVDEPQFNHNGGEVAFGPDGFLYFTLGDGGGAHDGLADDPPSHGPIGNGQNIDTVLGAILRIDVDGGSPYAIPADNPFVGRDGQDEIYAYGMRNPYKFSFDDGPKGDGALFLADVGQNLFEEVNIVEKGGNYGWVIREGLHCFDPFNPRNPPADCADTGPEGEPLLDPIVEYSHEEGGISIIGGFVSRGSRMPSLWATYVFGDFSASFGNPSGRLYFLVDRESGGFEIREFRIGAADVPYGLFLKGFGEDEEGEIYVCGSTVLGPTGQGGVVQRILEPCPDDPAPQSQGYWHRQCLGVPASAGGIDPGRNGRGPSGPNEPGFVGRLMPCAGARLGHLGFDSTTCQGMDADPASDPCERAEKQLTSLLLNVCSGRLTDACEVDAGDEGCAAATVGELIDEVAGLIHDGSCSRAAACAAAVNEGGGLVDGSGAGETTGEVAPVPADDPSLERPGKLRRPDRGDRERRIRR